jgi:hypothetical protein
MKIDMERSKRALLNSLRDMTEDEVKNFAKLWGVPITEGKELNHPTNKIKSAKDVEETEELGKGRG